jgi:glycosyltransferase involved in cell wall biosynthesis
VGGEILFVKVMFSAAEPPYPDLIMGGQLDCHGLARHLTEQGHRCVLTATRSQDKFWSRVDRKLDRTLGDITLYRPVQSIRARLGSRHWTWQREEFSGYSIYRMHDRNIMELTDMVLKIERPDVVMTQGGCREELALLALANSIPAMIRLVTTENVDAIADMMESVPELPKSISGGEMSIISNSEFIASRVRSRLGVHSPVIYPPVSIDACVSSEHSPKFITFVNPIPQKGVSIAIRIAQLLPHRDFCFVRSWPLNTRAMRELEARLDGLPNVYLRPPTFDMRSVYESASLLLAPSQRREVFGRVVLEAFGRVVLEACANGIPVVASAVGGIPEALGGGGILLSAADPAERWAQTIETVLTDADLYQRLSSAGLQHAQQAKFDVRNIADKFVQQAEILLGHRTSTARAPG